MKDKRLTKILKEKENVENEINAIDLENKSLKETKDYYEKNERELRIKEKVGTLRESYDKIIERLNNSINKNEQQKKYLEEIKKELITRIRIIKSNETKIETKRKIIEELNSTIENINIEINTNEAEKLNKLRELQKQNISKFNNLKKKIKSWENFKKLYRNDEKKLSEIKIQIDEAISEYQKIEEVVAKDFEQICKKYDTIKNEQKAKLVKKVQELKKINKNIETLKATIEKSFLIIENLMKDSHISEKVLAKSENSMVDSKIIVANEFQKFLDVIDKVNKKKAETQESEREEVIENSDTLENETTENEVVKKEIEKIHRELDSEIIEEINVEIDSKEELQHIEEVEKIDQNGDEEENADIEFESTQQGGPIYNKAYASMIQRNGPINVMQQNLISEDNEADAQNVYRNTLIYNWKNRKTIKKMILRESNNNSDKSKYIEIDGEKFKHNRSLDGETKRELDTMCRRYFNIFGKMTLKEKIKMQRLKLKLDPAVINAIKCKLKLKLEKRKKEILNKNNSNVMSSEVLEQIEECKRSYNYEYEEFINQYMDFLEEKDPEKLSFYLVYDCSEKLNAIKFMETFSYISSAEKSGAIIVDKHGFIEAVKDLFEHKSVGNNKEESRYVEGDKSFVPKVNVGVAPASKVLSNIANKIKSNTNKSMNDSNNYR